MYIAYVWGVFPHECVVLWVVKTTLLSFPVEYAIAPIVYSIHVLKINLIFNFHFVSKIYLLHSKVTSSTCTLISLTYLQERCSVHVQDLYSLQQEILHMY